MHFEKISTLLSHLKAVTCYEIAITTLLNDTGRHKSRDIFRSKEQLP